MKVVCVKEGYYDDKNGVTPRLVVGNLYTVIREVRTEDEYNIYFFYTLEEMGDDFGYGRQNFAPVSSIDEREFVRDYNKETV